MPVGGIGALRSIETSIGTYSLMMAPPTPGGYLLARNLNDWQDTGQNYSDCFVTIGSIVFSEMGAPCPPLQHVIGSFAAVGTLNEGGPSQPSVEILFNEINDTAGVGFVVLPEILQEPPIGLNVPSKTTQMLRWPVNAMNAINSQFVGGAGIQVRISWEPENAPNSLIGLSFSEDQV